MRQHPLGQTGLTVSVPGLGCMGMSEFYGPADETESLDALAAALDLGYDFLDTADTYGLGHNETLLGRFLKGRRDRVVLATKFGIVRPSHSPDDSAKRRIDNTPAYLTAACEASLTRLGVETIDLYYCHRRNPKTPLAEMIGAMARLVEQGKVRGLGLSEVSPETLRAAHAIHPIAAVQSEYSLWSRGPEDEMLQTCRDLDVTFVAYAPLGRGFLTGSLDPTRLAADDFRRGNPRFQADALTRNQRLLDGLSAIAARRNASSGQIALAWLVDRAPGVVPIPGTRRVSRLAENAAAMDLALTPGEIAELDGLFPPGAAAGARYAAGGTAGIEVL
ncbi:aldo/keto reductase [Methylobacterium sp. Leaf465]|uniref:aldo/keto reductase n=1 Tax=Methylobacterium sp. Leaf465 TaxID=1736385 RepID=UPI0006F50429|nr:aldo/keto reductase [Methylobacterium sp. Leaf465]KQT69515.1 aldo/keto reductase [Methylobacterium sp. Leaf465]